MAIVVAGLVLRFLLLPARWINPDEGAHLMDAQLLLDGFIPAVDYGARQPFYVLLLAGWIRLVGHGHAAARILPLLFNCAVIGLVFLLARRLFGATVGLVAAALLALLPFALAWSTIVHTQPFTIALATAGMLLLVRYLQGGRWLDAAAAGASFALGFYVRESSLALPVAATLTLLTAHPRGSRAALPGIGLMLGGYLAVVVPVLLIYSKYLPLPALWESAVNPLGIVAESIDKLAGVFGSHDDPGSQASQSFRDPTQPWPATLRYLRQVVRLNAPLIAGGVVAPLLLLSRSGDRADRVAAWRRLAPLIWWVVCLGLLYAYWLLHRGFYPQYFAEFLPPLAILTAVAVVRLGEEAALRPAMLAAGGVVLLVLALASHLPSIGVELSNLTLVALGGLAGLVAFGPAAVRRPGRLAAAIGALALLSLAVGRFTPASGPARLVVKLIVLGLMVAIPAGILLYRTPLVAARVRGAAAAGLIAASGLVAAAASGRLLSPSYECVWAPATVDEISRYIAARSAPDDQVMSGGMIWEFEAQRRPFAGITHPLSFLGGMPPDQLARARAQLARRLPRFVVLDGYAELTYLAHLPELADLLQTRYTVARRLGSKARPVQLLELAPAAMP